MYYRGTPILWSSKRQSIRATSTCEAEYVALYDAIKLSQSAGFLDWFDQGLDGDLPTLFCDNQSAIAVAKTDLPTKRSKHMLLRFQMVKDHFKSLCLLSDRFK